MVEMGRRDRPGAGVVLDEVENKWMSAAEAPLNGAATLSVVLLSEVAALLRSCAPAAHVVTNTRAIPKIGLIIPIVLRLSLSAPTAPRRFSPEPRVLTRPPENRSVESAGRKRRGRDGTTISQKEPNRSKKDGMTFEPLSFCRAEARVCTRVGYRTMEQLCIPEAKESPVPATCGIHQKRRSVGWLLVIIRRPK